MQSSIQEEDVLVPLGHMRVPRRESATQGECHTGRVPHRESTTQQEHHIGRVPRIESATQ